MGVFNSVVPVDVEAADVAWNQLQPPPVHCKDVSVPLTAFSILISISQLFKPCLKRNP